MPCVMSSSVMNFTVSAVKVAASVRPLPTAPDPSLLRGVAKAAGAGVADCAIPTITNAAAIAVMHSNKGSFRLVIASASWIFRFFGKSFFIGVILYLYFEFFVLV